MTERRSTTVRDQSVKLIVVAGEVPWNGVAYTTRDGAKLVYGDALELLRMVAELTGWPLPELPETATGGDDG